MSHDRLTQDLWCSAAFALGGLLGREWPGVDLDDGGVDWTMEAEDNLRSGDRGAGHRESPQTPGQMAMVCEWEEGR